MWLVSGLTLSLHMADQKLYIELKKKFETLKLKSLQNIMPSCSSALLEASNELFISATEFKAYWLSVCVYVCMCRSQHICMFCCVSLRNLSSSLSRCTRYLLLAMGHLSASRGVVNCDRVDRNRRLINGITRLARALGVCGFGFNLNRSQLHSVQFTSSDEP